MCKIIIATILYTFIINLANSSTNVEDELFPFEDLPPIWSDHMKSTKQTLENYPSPFENYKACNRDSNNSYICDPGGVLDKYEADKIDGTSLSNTEILRKERINSNHFCSEFGEVPFQFGVGIASDSLKNDKELLATELCNRWSLSHPGCNDGIILILFPYSKDMILHWESGVEPLINVKIASAFYRICRNELSNRSFAQGVEKCVKFIAKRLSGETLPMEETLRKIVFLIIATVTGLFYITCLFTGKSTYDSVMVDRA